MVLKKRELSDRVVARFEVLGFKLQVRADGVVAVCSHGFKHPVPKAGQSLKRATERLVHRCDGCCSIFQKRRLLW